MKKETLFYWCLLLLKYLQKVILDPILDYFWKYTTLKGCKEERLTSKRYETSAQRVKIWTRGAYSVPTIHLLHNFLYTHVEYIHPKEVLFHDHITLMGMDETFAWFCVTKNDFDVYDLSQFSFVYTTQFLHAQELIIIPLWSLTKLVDLEMSSRKKPEIIFLFNSARCGSTLACQMFHKMPKTIAISEPYVFTNANFTFSYKKLGQSMEDIMRALVLLQCKPSIDSPFERVLIKPCITSTSVLPFVKKACPFVKIVFNTRLTKHSNVSYYQLYTGHHFDNYVDEFKYSSETCWLKTPIPITSVHNQDHLYQILRRHFYKISFKEIELKPISMYCLSLLTYLQNKHSVDYLLIYDDWMKDTEGETENLLDALDIPKTNLPYAMTAIKKDSQANFFTSRTTSKSNVFNQDQLKRIDWVYQILGLPLTYDMELEKFKTFLSDFTCNDQKVSYINRNYNT